MFYTNAVFWCQIKFSACMNSRNVLQTFETCFFYSILAILFIVSFHISQIVNGFILMSISCICTAHFNPLIKGTNSLPLKWKSIYFSLKINLFQIENQSISDWKSIYFRLKINLFWINQSIYQLKFNLSIENQSINWKSIYQLKINLSIENQSIYWKSIYLLKINLSILKINLFQFCLLPILLE